MPSVVPAAAGNSVAAGSWRDAFAGIGRTSFRVLLHRAAASTQPADLAAAYALMWQCVRSNVPVHILKSQGLALTPDQIAAKTALRERCTGNSQEASAQLEQAEARMTVSADVRALVSALAVPPGDATSHAAVWHTAMQSGSAALQYALAPTLAQPALMYQMGLPQQAGVPPLFDQGLASWALAIRACREQGNCKQAALENHLCVATDECVSDLASYPGRHLLNAEQTGSLSKIFQHLSADQRRQRWQEINAFFERAAARPGA